MTETTPCNVNACDRRPHLRGMCQTHYKRWLATGEPGGPIRQKLKNANNACTVIECDRPARSRGWCEAHYIQSRSGKEPAGRVIPRGEWQEAVTYSGMHARLKREYGLASSHLCTDCGFPAEDWSYDNEAPDELVEFRDGKPRPYSLSPEHYAPRCKQCHIRLDLSTGIASWDVSARVDKQSCPHGHLLDDANSYVATGTTRVECRTCRRERVALYDLARRS